MPATIVYAPLSQAGREYLDSARKAVTSMRQLLVKRALLDEQADVPSLVQAAIGYAPLRIRELPGQQEALGVALGDELARRLGWSWMSVTDDWGEGPAVVAPGVTAHAYPLGWVGKRLEDAGEFDGVAEWFARLVVTCQQTASDAGPRQ